MKMRNSFKPTYEKFVETKDDGTIEGNSKQKNKLLNKILINTRMLQTKQESLTNCEIIGKYLHSFGGR